MNTTAERAIERAPNDREQRMTEWLRALCALSARIGRIRTPEGPRWLGELCGYIREGFSSEVGVVSAVRVWRGDSLGWGVECVARSRGYGEWTDGHIESLRSSGTARGLFPGMPESARRPRDPLVLARSEMIGDAKWRESSLLAERARRGLYEFAWSSCAVDGPGPARTLMIQLDGLSPSWSLDREGAMMLSVAAELAQENYAGGPLCERARRAALLEELSPMRRRVAPLLATGMSETEIAEKLGRSRHTVHEHAKAIYQQWRVNSRHELRTLWLGLREDAYTTPLDDPGSPTATREDAPANSARSRGIDGPGAFASDPPSAPLVFTPTRPTDRASGSAPGAPRRARSIR